MHVVEVGSSRTHNRNHKGPWGPVHDMMIHHTATSGAQKTMTTCHHGYEGPPGPLCHGVTIKDGHVHLVGYGRANHAGLGDDDVLRAVIAEKALPRTTRPTPTATTTSTASSARTSAKATPPDPKPKSSPPYAYPLRSAARAVTAPESRDVALELAELRTEPRMSVSGGWTRWSAAGGRSRRPQPPPG